MVLSTMAVGAAVAPAVMGTAISHYIKRKPLRGKPTAHISYDEGLHLVRRFLEYASVHTVDEMQAFTSQWVPSPRWVRTEDITIPDSLLVTAAGRIEAQLGPDGIRAVGGSKWWQWRPDNTPLKAEWIEMRKDYNERKVKSQDATRIILYIHGGAYFFGSVDEHRYQMQRHARKLKARMLAPRYRLSPQFPFPCGLQDSLAAYLFLLESYSPSQILVAGDSAGGGMCLSLLVTLRDQGLPLPAGALLLSPWVDLTHSFPSIAGDGNMDYIPSTGFHHKPSMAWPPPNSDELKELRAGTFKKVSAPRRSSRKRSTAEEEIAEFSGVRVSPQIGSPEVLDSGNANGSSPNLASLAPDENITIEMDGKRMELLDQIQLYTTNQLLTNPLVSPVMQPTLGGLPPLLIQTGGGELLCDEQVYVAHKAANPSAYLAPEPVLDKYDPERKAHEKYPPTMVQLQLWEDLCHVPHTLSFTRPAKHMYRAVAQFGNWAYAHAANAPQVETKADEEAEAASIISSDTDAEGEETLHSPDLTEKTRSLSEGAVAPTSRAPPTSNGTTNGANTKETSVDPSQQTPLGTVAANEPLPEFKDHMIRQAINRHGTIFDLPPASELPGCTIPREEIGVIKPYTARKWLLKKAEFDRKFASQKRKVQNRRADDAAKGFEIYSLPDGSGVETPPPTALAGRRSLQQEERDSGVLANLSATGKSKKKSWGLAMWSGWGSKHDTTTIEHSADAHQHAGDTPPTPTPNNELDSAAQRSASVGADAQLRPIGEDALPKGQKVEGSENTFLAPGSARPHNGTVAYPFKIRGDLVEGGREERSASTVTLHSDGGQGLQQHEEEEEEFHDARAALSPLASPRPVQA